MNVQRINYYVHEELVLRASRVILNAVKDLSVYNKILHVVQNDTPEQVNAESIYDLLTQMIGWSQCKCK